jgi:hypothetical protein
MQEYNDTAIRNWNLEPVPRIIYANHDNNFQGGGTG